MKSEAVRSVSQIELGATVRLCLDHGFVERLVERRMNEKKGIQTDSKEFLHFLFLFFPLNKSLHKSKTQRRPKNALGVIAVVDDMGL